MDTYTVPSFSLSGPSGCGKSTVIGWLPKLGIDVGFSISATTRLRREDEIHGVHYYFLSEEEFQVRIKREEFAEWVRGASGVLYGTLWSEIFRQKNDGKIVILDVDIAGSKSLEEKLGPSHFSTFLHSPFKKFEKRLRERNTESEAQINARLEKAKSELAGMEGRTPIFSNVLNDEGEFAANQFARFIKRKIATLNPVLETKTSLME